MKLFHLINEKLDTLLQQLIKCQGVTQKAMLNIEEASAYLGISVSTLYKHTSRGNIPFYKPNGKLILFKRDDLNTWIASKRILSNSELLNNNENGKY
jgi:excisionase family DNA binding protein